MDERLSQRMLRSLLIAIPGFMLGMCACGTVLSTESGDAASAYGLGVLFIGTVSLVIGWLVAGLVRKQRFVQVPRYSEEDTYDLEGEKPKRR